MPVSTIPVSWCKQNQATQAIVSIISYLITSQCSSELPENELRGFLSSEVQSHVTNNCIVEFVESLVEDISDLGSHVMDLQERLKSLNLECQGLRDANQGLPELAMVEKCHLQPLQGDNLLISCIIVLVNTSHSEVYLSAVMEYRKIAVQFFLSHPPKMHNQQMILKSGPNNSHV